MCRLQFCPAKLFPRVQLLERSLSYRLSNQPTQCIRPYTRPSRKRKQNSAGTVRFQASTGHVRNVATFLTCWLGVFRRTESVQACQPLGAKLLGGVALL